MPSSNELIGKLLGKLDPGLATKVGGIIAENPQLLQTLLELYQAYLQMRTQVEVPNVIAPVIVPSPSELPDDFDEPAVPEPALPLYPVELQAQPNPPSTAIGYPTSHTVALVRAKDADQAGGQLYPESALQEITKGISAAGLRAKLWFDGTSVGPDGKRHEHADTAALGLLWKPKHHFRSAFGEFSVSVDEKSITEANMQVMQVVEGDPGWMGIGVTAWRYTYGYTLQVQGNGTLDNGESFEYWQTVELPTGEVLESNHLTIKLN